MLDIKIIRKNPQSVKKNLKKRGENEKIKWIDDLLKKDKEALKIKKQVEDSRHKRNVISLKINALKKKGKSAKKEILEAKSLPKKIESLEKKQDQLKKKAEYYLWHLPNIVHESVPIGKDESENKVIRKVGAKPKFNFSLKAHGELIEDLNVADFKVASKVSGSGFVYIKGELALLDLALQRFAIDFLLKKGFILIEPPLILRRDAYEGVVPLDQFKTMMYKIQEEDSYLIGTAEHPLTVLHSGELIKEENLPLKYIGVSPCFRKEIGSHGVDTRGLFRMHQFNKVEQYVFSKPKDSWKIFDQLLKNQEEMFQKLKILYRVIVACSGDTSFKDAKMCDLEAYFPREKMYKEITSCSNCTTYQSVRSNIKFIDKKGNKDYVHTLNATGMATSRAMRAIIENYQQKDGSIKIPSVLRKYTGFSKISSK